MSYLSEEVGPVPINSILISRKETAHRFLKILYPSGQLNKWWPIPEESAEDSN